MRGIVLTMFLFLEFGFVPTQASQCAQYLGQCEYYSCLSAEKKCLQKEYLMSFGYKYCERFDQQLNHFSSYAQTVLGDIKMCLQVELENEAEISQLSCKKIRKKAQEHHLRCYLETDFCNLPKKDKLHIVSQVSNELLQADFLRTVLRINHECESR